MFIKAITTNEVMRRGAFMEDVTRTSTFGKARDKSVCIDTWKKKDGVTFAKRIVFWNDKMQQIVNKVRNNKGKFDRIG